MKFLRVFISVLILGFSGSAKSWTHGQSETPFNGGKFQVNLNFPGIGGDYPFLNILKNSSGSWNLRDNQGTPSPADLDNYAYPLNGSDAITNHLGVSLVVNEPAVVYVGGNCIPAQSGTCLSTLINGKGTYVNPGTIITSTASSVVTGSTTTINFASTQDFRAGMEVPISGTTGVTATNGGGGSLTSGGTSGAWTVCAAGLTSTSIRLCLNDQITPLTTTGTAGGTTTVTYGRNAVGVTQNARIVSVFTSGAVSFNFGISAQDATTPITYRNGRDGLVVVHQGGEETRWETCPYPDRECFGAAFLAKLNLVKPGVIRSLNSINTNESLEVNWADRKPIGYVSYGAQIYNRSTGGAASNYAGTTTSVRNDYSVTLGSGAPTDGQQLSINFDATSVTVSSGANAIVSWTAHGLRTGQPFYFGFAIGGGGALPGGVSGPAVGVSSTTWTYYAITGSDCPGTPCTADQIQFATSVANALAGTAVTTTTTGTSVLAHASTAQVSATLTNGSSSIAWPNANTLDVGDRVACAGIGTLSYPFNNGVAYFVKTIPDSSHITVSATSGGVAITSLQSGTFGCTKVPTLSLNGTTAVPIMDDKYYGVGLVKSTQPVSRLSGTKAYGTLTYDGVLGVWSKSGADASFGTRFFTSGWPPEIFLRLCKIIGAQPWFQPPSHTIDRVAGITDYNTGLYAMVRANQSSWMIPRFEVIPNEFWNNGFTATALGVAHAVVYADTAGWSTNTGTYQIAGKIASVLGQAVQNEYGGAIDGTKYQTIVGVQTFNFSASSGASTNAPRLTSTDYIAQSTSPQSPYTKSAAKDWATHVACAQYFTPGYYGTFVNTTLAAANAGGVINGTFTGGTNNLTVSTVRVVTSPVFGIGSVITQGNGITAPITVTGGSAPNWTTDTVLPNTLSGANFNYLASGSDATAVQTLIDSSVNNATFTGSISGTVLTATGVTGFITTGSGSGGDFIMGSGVPSYIHISSQASGTTGKDGTYNLTISGGTISSRAMTSNGVFSLPSEQLMYAAVFAFAQTYTNRDGVALGMNGYEGGYSPDYVSAGLSLTDQIAARGKVTTSSPGSATGIYGYVLLNAQNFKAAGGEFPSLFQFTGLTPSSNAWSSIDDIYQSDPTPVLDAYRDYNFLLKRDMQEPGASNDNDPMWLEKAA